MGRGEEVADRVPLKMGFVSMGAKKMKPVCVASMNCLPDELLVQILSFLPTRKAASTSVLSKRWRHLFTFSHHLDIDYSFFWLPKKSKSKNFREFVDRTLALQGGNCIQTFSVKFKGHDIDGHGVVVVKNWIRNALEHGVSELHLCLDSIYGRSFQSFDFPSKVFTNTTLVKLSLGTYQHIPSLPSNTYLPALKVLSLDSIWFERDQLSDVFLAACPTLEDLTIHHKSSSKVPPKIISSKTIKKLSVTINFNYSDYGFDYSDYDFDYIGMISLDIPSVVDLYYSDYSQRQYPRCNFDSLVKATLDLHFLDADADVTNLISGIRNVKALHLISSAVKVISVCCKGGLPMFNNLIDLVFSSKIGGRKWLLARLLKNSPNLKTLVVSDLDYACRKNHFVQNQIPFNNQIKMLSIMQYEGRENELKHISHFFLNMKSLEVVKVYVAPSMDDTKKMQLTEDLLKLPTASSKLKIQVM